MNERSKEPHSPKSLDKEASGSGEQQNAKCNCSDYEQQQSELDELEQAWGDSLQKYKSFFENSDLAIFQTTPEGGLISANTALAHMLGYESSAEILAYIKNIPEQLYVNPEDRQRIIGQFSDGRDSLSTETCFLRKDGGAITVNLKVRVVRGKNGKPLYYEGYAEDITERKLAAERQAKIGRLKEELLAPGDLDEKLKRITEGVVRILDADFARVWVLEKDDPLEPECAHGEVAQGNASCNRTYSLHLRASSGRYTHLDGNHSRVPLGAYKIGRVASGEMPEFVTNDVVHDPQVHDHEWAKSLGLVSFAGFRLLSPEGKPIGVIALFSKHHINADEVALLKDLANVTSHVVLTGMVEKALRDSEKKLRSLYDSMTDAYSSTDLSGKIIDFNDAFKDMVGYTEEELHQLTFFDLTPKKWHSMEEKIIQEVVLKRGGSDLYEKEYVRKDGKVFPVELRVYLIQDENGNPAGFWSIVRDITERKRIEVALRNSERRLSDIINFLPDATFVIDNEGKVIAWNRATEEMTGVKAEDMIGKGYGEYSIAFYGRKRTMLLDLVHKPLDEVKNVYECVLKEGQTLIAETYSPVLKPGGAYLWFRSTPLHDAEGKAAGAIETVRDVTERKLAEDYKREFYRRTIMAATDGKLLMTEVTDIYKAAGESIAEYNVSHSEDVGEMRRAVEKIARAEGMEEFKISDFAVAISEASTNALKHAGEGKASIHKLPDSLMFVVKDCGPGIEAMTIPQVAFVKGYTTAGTLGMGYKIIITLADRVLLATSVQGTTVAIEMKLHAQSKEELTKNIDWVKGSI